MDRMRERNILDFVNMSETAKSVHTEFLKPNNLIDLYRNISDDEKEALVLHYIVNGNAYLFKNIPLLYDQLVRFLSNRMNVGLNDIKLIGSSKLGFTMDSSCFGREVNDKSDLDFTIISESLFDKFKEDNMNWQKAYKEGNLQPKTKRENKYWKDNVVVNNRNLNKGFIDSNKNPNNEQYCPTTLKLNRALDLIVKQLESIYGIKLSHASVRVYKNFDSFMAQLMFNTNAQLGSKRV